MTSHAVGAQVYECATDAAGKPAWQFREPIATLLINGRTIGRHFAGPTWQLADGSAVVARMTGRAPGATSDDIPCLKLDVTAGQGTGQLASVTHVQRINTKGGALAGTCDHPGGLRAVPYESDYVFLTKAG
jgi:hypothetical protein